MAQQSGHLTFDVTAGRHWKIPIMLPTRIGLTSAATPDAAEQQLAP